MINKKIGNGRKNIRTIIEKKKLSKKDIITLLSIDNENDKYSLNLLFNKANNIRQQYLGDEIYLRGIIEFSNYCKNNCNYCGIRRDNNKVKRYRMTSDEIISIAKDAYKNLGYSSVVLQSGEDDYYTESMLCNMIKEIKTKTDLAIVLSIGERKISEYKKFKEAGASRVLIRFETSNNELYKKLHPKSSIEKNSLKKRIILIKKLKGLGYFIGSGPMIGLPNQTMGMLADDILLFDKLKIDMAAMGPYISHQDTPMANSKNGSVDLTLKMIAVTRLVCKDIFIPSTTALQTLDKSSGRQKALICGANILMPNITPQKYRKHYLLYPNKVCTDENPEDCANCVRGVISSVKRKVGNGVGHPIRKYSKSSKDKLV